MSKNTHNKDFTKKSSIDTTAEQLHNLENMYCHLNDEICLTNAVADYRRREDGAKGSKAPWQRVWLYGWDAQSAVRKKVVKTFSIKENDFDQALKEARQQVKSQLKGLASSHSRLLYMQRMLEIMGLGMRARKHTKQSLLLKLPIMFCASSLVDNDRHRLVRTGQLPNP